MGLGYRRVSGPGISQDVYYEVPHALALASMIAEMEHEQLGLWDAKLRGKLGDAVRNYLDAVAPAAYVRGDYSGAAPPDAPGYRQIAASNAEHFKTIAKAVAEREQALSPLRHVSEKGHIRLKAEDLARTLAEGAVAAKSFFEQRVFPTLTSQQVDKFWTDHGLARGDWTGLSRKMLANVYGKGVLEPWEVSDKNLLVEIKAPGAEDLLARVLGGRNLDLGEVKVPVNEVLFRDLEAQPKARYLAGAELCQLPLGKIGGAR
jgi:hypothetical protein